MPTGQRLHSGSSQIVRSDLIELRTIRREGVVRFFMCKDLMSVICLVSASGGINSLPMAHDCKPCSSGDL